MDDPLSTAVAGGGHCLERGRDLRDTHAPRSSNRRCCWTVLPQLWRPACQVRIRGQLEIRMSPNTSAPTQAAVPLRPRCLDGRLCPSNARLTCFRSTLRVFPELVGQWLAPGTMRRAKGFAFAAPLQTGKTAAGRQFAEAYTTRQAEMAESRSSFGLIREEVFLNQTPD